MTDDDYKALVARLRREEESDIGEAVRWPINPDGEEAADAIEALMAERDAAYGNADDKYKKLAAAEAIIKLAFDMNVTNHPKWESMARDHFAQIKRTTVVSDVWDKAKLEAEVNTLRADLAAAEARAERAEEALRAIESYVAGRVQAHIEIAKVAGSGMAEKKQRIRQSEANIILSKIYILQHIKKETGRD